ncbi:unnamed protein product [Nezara viridula]|uniref:Uncharacterized protein n=1 Tax=Nezara viridula TaxID=85310 RepID=A0A9P0HR69_NEZVI|nr:unnamed protein product [Nezara viridula]
MRRGMRREETQRQARGRGRSLVPALQLNKKRVAVPAPFRSPSEDNFNFTPGYLILKRIKFSARRRERKLNETEKTEQTRWRGQFPVSVSSWPGSKTGLPTSRLLGLNANQVGSENLYTKQLYTTTTFAYISTFFSTLFNDYTAPIRYSRAQKALGKLPAKAKPLYRIGPSINRRFLSL